MLVSIDTSTEKPLPLGKGGFTFIAIEKDPDYWKASVERLEIERSQLRFAGVR